MSSSSSKNSPKNLDKSGKSDIMVSGEFGYPEENFDRKIQLYSQIDNAIPNDEYIKYCCKSKGVMTKND